MYSTTERIRRVKLRARRIQQKKESRLLGGLSGLSLVLSFSLMGVIRSITGKAQGKASGNYGAMILYEDMGGYVLVAVITFILASFITVACIRYQERKKTLEKEEK